MYLYLYLYNNTRLLVVYYYIVTARAPHLDNGHTTCVAKNDTPAVSAPEFIAIPKGGHNHPKGGFTEGAINWVLEWRGLITNRALREIQNYRN